MPKPEKIIARIAGSLLVLSAILEGISRLGDQPAFHEPAVWVLMAFLCVVLTPVFFATVIVAFQALVARKKDHDSDAA
jgi:hypothetical protein